MIDTEKKVIIEEINEIITESQVCLPQAGNSMHDNNGHCTWTVYTQKNSVDIVYNSCCDSLLMNATSFFA